MDSYRRLYRSRTSRLIAGVCGGIGEYFGIDPIIVRIIAVVAPGVGWVAYLVCALIIPEEG